MTPPRRTTRPDRRHGVARRSRHGLHQRGRDRGAGAAELALVTPVFILLLLFVAQLALIAHADHIAATTARQTVEAARADGAPVDAGQTRAQLLFTQLAPHLLLDPAAAIDVGPDTVTVTITGRAPNVIPLIHPKITARATGVRERFRPQVQGLAAGVGTP
ncbi:TadE family protein [Frankia sp. AgB1.8]|nr:TadE family protein [Frankia sp. AgB1.8]